MSKPKPKPKEVSRREFVSAAAARKLFWRHDKQEAVRSGRWKYLNDGGREYLFDLSFDQTERADFRERRPEVFRELRSEFETWQARVLPRPKREG